MTVSQMSLTEMTESPQQQQHWLGEQVLNWSGVPVAHVRSTLFLEPFFSSMATSSIAKDGTDIPFFLNHLAFRSYQKLRELLLLHQH